MDLRAGLEENGTIFMLGERLVGKQQAWSNDTSSYLTTNQCDLAIIELKFCQVYLRLREGTLHIKRE